MQAIEDFFRGIDRHGPRQSAGKLELRIIGSTALMLQTDYERGTSDSDVLESRNGDAEVRARLLAIAERGTELARRHRMHLQIVLEAIPFLPRRPSWHPVPGLADLTHFTVTVLDIVDVVVSKLLPFRPSDIDDIAAMVARSLVPHGALVGRFTDAVAVFADEARADDLPRCVDNLHQIERDHFGVAASDIQLPSWV
ncbi:MAG: hypothetical protein M3680_22710 [Myxococcota bacterium]|nr:hypothetical protein [Myxococcota bacterium]